MIMKTSAVVILAFGGVRCWIVLDCPEKGLVCCHSQPVERKLHNWFDIQGLDVVPLCYSRLSKHWLAVAANNS